MRKERGHLASRTPGSSDMIKVAQLGAGRMGANLTTFDAVLNDPAIRGVIAARSAATGAPVRL